MDDRTIIQEFRTTRAEPPPAALMDLAERWWTIALRGAAAIAFGVLSLIAPSISLVALVVLFGIYVLVDGLLSLVLAGRGPHDGPRWTALIVGGLVSLVAAAVALTWPGVTAISLVLLIGAWAVVTGAAEIAAAIRLQQQIDHEWVLVLSGCLSITFGVLVLLFPGAGAVAMVMWIAAYAILFGALLLALGFRLRAWARHFDPDWHAHGAHV
jgi:uncharacterized membrane protein HdeD (DUF308 family)